MRILIVDDEAGVLQALMAILRALPGHDLKVAANAQKACEHAVAMGGVDLLITDVVMEPTDGFTLRAELQANYPAMQTVFISGYDLSDYAEHIAGAPTLAKPVDAMALITEIGNAVACLSAPVAAVVPEKARLSGKTTAIAVPAAAPQAVAQPVAVPQAVAQPVARAVPQATAIPTAQPVAVPQAGAQPVARAVPQATAVPTAQPVAVTQAAAPAGDVHDPLVGVQLGDYRVQQLIGEGKWGRVYLALQLSVNRRVGLKVLSPASAEDESMRTHFMNDARAKAAVQHQSIMTVFEADERNGLFFFTQEYIEGASLAERIGASQLLDEKTALHVL
ncbi:MAG: response regulator, partial [Chthoniobacteraceae bacterium]